MEEPLLWARQRGGVSLARCWVKEAGPKALPAVFMGFGVGRRRGGGSRDGAGLWGAGSNGDLEKA